MENKSKNINVLLVDDHKVFRAAIKGCLLAHGKYKIADEASNEEEFLKLIESKLPDVVLMDINMPVLNGIEATRIAVEKFASNIKIIAISTHDEELCLDKMKEAGFSGYVNKNSITAHLEQTIKAVLNGETCFSNNN